MECNKSLEGCHCQATISLSLNNPIILCKLFPTTIKFRIEFAIGLLTLRKLFNQILINHQCLWASKEIEGYWFRCHREVKIPVSNYFWVYVFREKLKPWQICNLMLGFLSNAIRNGGCAIKISKIMAKQILYLGSGYEFLDISEKL